MLCRTAVARCAVLRKKKHIIAHYKTYSVQFIIGRPRNECKLQTVFRSAAYRCTYTVLIFLLAHSTEPPVICYSKQSRESGVLVQQLKFQQEPLKLNPTDRSSLLITARPVHRFLSVFDRPAQRSMIYSEKAHPTWKLKEFYTTPPFR
jgi:hypothetical protein